MDGNERELRRDLKIAESKREALCGERAKLFAKVRAGSGSDGDEERLVNLNRGIGRLDDVITDIEDKIERHERLVEKIRSGEGVAFENVEDRKSVV